MQPAEPSLPALPRPPSFTRQQTPLLNLADEVNLHDDGPQLSRIAPKDASNLLLALKRPPDECAFQFNPKVFEEKNSVLPMTQVQEASIIVIEERCGSLGAKCFIFSASIPV